MKLRIKDVIKVKKRKVQDVAEAVGMTKGAFSNLINEKVGTTIDRIEKIADALGVTYLELIEPPEGYTDLKAGDKHIGVIREEYSKNEQ